jgi:hypothetical protein
VLPLRILSVLIAPLRRINTAYCSGLAVVIHCHADVKLLLVTGHSITQGTYFVVREAAKAEQDKRLLLACHNIAELLTKSGGADLLDKQQRVDYLKQLEQDEAAAAAAAASAQQQQQQSSSSSSSNNSSAASSSASASSAPTEQ